MDAHWSAVTENIQDAAAQVLSHSFAVYRVESATATKIVAAHRTAGEFFNRTTNQSNKKGSPDHFENYRRIKDGDLYGYNVPLPSKELFRTWYACDTKYKNDDREEQELEAFRCQQPWPSEELCEASFHLAKDLHRLLSECLWQIYKLQNNNSRSSNRVDEKETYGNSDPSVLRFVQDHSRQRRPVPIDPPARKRFRSTLGTITFHEGTSSDVDKSNSRRHFFRPNRCPLDYFFYHNKFPKEINCSEHVDRGALVVVCLTNIPGLEVRSSLASEPPSFHCPEALVHNQNLYRERSDCDCCPGLVCIIAGDQLSRILSSANTPSACVHRVKNPLWGARLSISYELRLKGL